MCCPKTTWNVAKRGFNLHSSQAARPPLKAHAFVLKHQTAFSQLGVGNLHTVSHSGRTPCHAPKQLHRVPSSPSPHQLLLFGVFNSHSDRCEVISHCSFDLLMTSDVQHGSHTCWPFAYLLWRKVCSSHFPIFHQLFGLHD